MFTKKRRNLLERIDKSFHALNGTPLAFPPGVVDRHKWLHTEAPYSILAHNGGEDPVFIYANEYALSCFKYTMKEMLELPSRLSTAEKDREAREELLKEVTKNGIAYNYSGPRVDKNGDSFMIYDGIVWELRDDDGTVWGQGALFWTDQKKRPDWAIGMQEKK